MQKRSCHKCKRILQDSIYDRCFVGSRSPSFFDCPSIKKKNFEKIQKRGRKREKPEKGTPLRVTGDSAEEESAAIVVGHAARVKVAAARL